MMLRKRLVQMTGTLVFIGFSLISGSSEAQLSPVPTPRSVEGATPPIGALLANPYANPYLNPYLNPIATQQPISGRDAALYMYMANSARGGLGSGQLSGTRPAAPANGFGVVVPQMQPGKQAKAAAQPRVNQRNAGRRPVAEMPDSVGVPGAAAARYFNPGPVNTNGAGKFYARRNTYFNSNGH